MKDLEIGVHNQEALEELAWTIEASQGQFALILARCNFASLQQRLAERLQEMCAVEIRMLVLQQSTKTLYARIREELEQGPPEALMVFGLEAIAELDQMLSAVNAVREEFRKNFQFPLVLWVTDDTLKRLVRLAPDLESWATTTEFTIAPNTLLQLLRQTIDTLFTTLLTPNSPLSFNQLLRTLPPTVLTRLELEAALSELRCEGEAIDPILQADLDFFRGLDFFRRLKKFENSDHLEWFQRSLAVWQSQDGAVSGLHNQLKRAVVLFYLGRSLYYAIERRERADDWQTAREPLQQCVDLFEQADRPDLVAKSITQLERVLDRAHAWTDLEATVRKSLSLQQTYGTLSRVAQDYRYLALAAVKQERWEQAEQVAEQALETILQVPEDQHYEGLYRLTLASAQRRLGKLEPAIAQLTQARKLGDQGHPRIYISILEELREIYRSQQRYLEAFQLKQARLSTEQQYGIRAFVGAGRLRPQREDAELLEIPDLAAEQTEEEIAPEIWASGRQRDLEELLLRMGRNDYKLIVVHGPSGVGKSSLVSAGLVPGLRRRAIGTRRNLPILIRQYSQCLPVVEAALLAAMPESVDAKAVHTDPQESADAILQLLQQSDAHHLRVVLIFDQFEEFFFTRIDPVRRRQFYEFLGQCLTFLNVKIVLSLREDYIHYLLEWQRVSSIAALGLDLLSQNVLYGLGNFSPPDARAIIESLTQRSQFYLEPALIDQLVRDLAGELGEVRPIELQIVGAQLQTEQITTLAQYQALGATPKQELVERYLEEVVGDCGSENRQIAELVLYLLTDDKGTRPLKTRAELEQDLQAWIPNAPGVADQLDLVLAIVVRSGLVMLLPEVPDDRYQLVHDYIAAFIREQQEPRLSRLLMELEKERKQRRLSEEKLSRVEHITRRRIRLGLISLAGISGLALAVVVWATTTSRNAIRKANQQTENARQTASQQNNRAKDAQKKAELAQQQKKKAEEKVRSAGNSLASLQRQKKELEQQSNEFKQQIVREAQRKETAQKETSRTKRVLASAAQQLKATKKNLDTAEQSLLVLDKDQQRLKKGFCRTLLKASLDLINEEKQTLRYEPDSQFNQFGSIGKVVRDLQEYLRVLGYYSGPTDGVFGLETETAVRRFQIAHGLYPDGIAGPRTLASIRGLGADVDSLNCGYEVVISIKNSSPLNVIKRYVSDAFLQVSETGTYASVGSFQSLSEANHEVNRLKAATARENINIDIQIVQLKK